MPLRPFRERLEDEAILFDGAMGTRLYEKGIFINRCFDELNLSEPELVKSIHTEYLEAGAEVLETNTFTANRVKLESHGFRSNLVEINYKGAKIARAVAGERAYVAGAIGPLGIRIEPWGPTSVDEAKEIFAEQAQSLLEGGVDLFVLETFSDINEIWQAIRAVRELTADIPIVAQMTLGEDGNSLFGTPPEVFGKRLEAWGADVIGVNCSVGPAIMLDAVERMAAVLDRPISAVPNAGLPREVDGRVMYLASPEYMASYVKRFIAAGARVVGGCCGTTPEHVRAIHDSLRGSAPVRRSPVTVTAAPSGIEMLPATPVARANKSRLARALDEGRFARVAEVRPARGLDQTNTLDGVRRLRDSGVEFIVVSEPARASARLSCQALAQIIEREGGLETVVHYSSRHRKLFDMQSDLLGAYALGLRNVLCETGDAPTLADGRAKISAGIDSIGLTNMVRRLNDGYDLGSSPIGAPTGWHLGVVANPTALDVDEEVRRFQWKVDAGAEFCVTRPVFEVKPLIDFLARIEHCRLPTIIGIRPMVSATHAEYLSNEVPGLSVPAQLVERMRRAGSTSDEEAMAEGVRIARELLTEVVDLGQGVIVACPSEHFEAAANVLAGCP